MSVDTCVIGAEDWQGADVCTIGDVGFGLLGSEIASSGTAGPGYTYNDLALPADAGKEICGRITTWPALGTLQAFEDTSFIYTRSSDGVDSFAYQLYVDGVAVGSPQNVTLAVGSTSTISLAGTATTQSASSGTGSVSVVPPSAGVINLAGSNTTQGAVSGTGSASVIRVRNLTGASCTQGSTSGTGAVGVIPVYTGGATPVPSSRTVNFGGGTNRVNFDGGTNRVNF